MKIRKIISGGQTGADRAAFDFALENGIEIGGFVPKGRLAEDGRVPDKYPNLQETSTKIYARRTELNAKEADATLILSHGELKGGSKFTAKSAEKFRKPFLHINFSDLTITQAVKLTRKWLKETDCKILNVAGARASGDAEIYEKTKKFLEKVFSLNKH